MSQNAFDLSGKVAIVTGSAGGLGKTISSALARAGATVALTDINTDALDAQKTTFDANGWECSTNRLDVADEAERNSVVDEIASRYGRIDILINNAGMILRKPATETSDREFSNLLNINLVGLFGMTTAVSGHMARNGYGRIISLSSIMGHIGRAGQATYVAAKHGVVGLTKSFAAEYGPLGITSNAIGPGYFRTDMNAELLRDERFVQSVELRTPLRRWADPEEIAGPIVFLSAPASSFVNGQFLMIDGGLAVTVPAPGQGS
jgi:gluconate 5-dehydrogenase